MKRRLLIITTQSLFGTGIIGLLKKQEGQLEIRTVPDSRTALEVSREFHPDVIVHFKESSLPEDEGSLQTLISRYHTRVIQCTLQANQLTIYDQTRIQNATVEDLMAAVLKQTHETDEITGR